MISCKKFGFFAISVLFLIANISSQDIAIKGKITIIHKNDGNSISLRWLPGNYGLWNYLNQYGYTIEKITILPGQKPERKILNSLPIKPIDRKDFEILARNDMYAAIAASILYHDTVKYSYSGFSGAISLEKLNKQRISFALLAADNSFDAAIASGLGYVDHELVKKAKYVYLVYASVKSDSVQVDTARVFINGSDVSYWPIPEISSAEFGNRTVTLIWEKDILKKYYHSYFIERSDDGGKTYKPLNKEPFVGMRDPEYKEFPRDIVMFRDSLPQNDYKYFFRIRGKNAFSDLGPWSKPVSGKGAIDIAIPELQNSEVINNKSIVLSWAFPDSMNYLIKGFELNLSTQSQGPYKVVSEKVIKPQERKLIYNSNNSSNYFIISAIRASDDQRFESFPLYVSLSDTVAPEAPTGGYGKIDSSGNVNIGWDKNKEEDVRGYRVYISNSLNDEFSQITDSAIQMNNLSFKIPLDNLTNTIYCKIQAEDFHFNGSQFSKVLEIIKPDTIKPTCPVFKKVLKSDTSIYLTWFTSSSEDVAFHSVYRKEKDSTTFLLIFKTKSMAEVLTYSDYNAEPGKVYEYYVTATDKSNNRSSPSPSFKATRLRSDDPEKLKLTGQADRTAKNITLNWKLPSKPVDRFIIYKSLDGTVPQYNCTLSGKTIQFADKELELNTSYLYRVIAEYNDGTRKTSDIVRINF